MKNPEPNTTIQHIKTSPEEVFKNIKEAMENLYDFEKFIQTLHDPEDEKAIKALSNLMLYNHLAKTHPQTREQTPLVIRESLEGFLDSVSQITHLKLLREGLRQVLHQDDENAEPTATWVRLQEVIIQLQAEYRTIESN